MSLGSRSLTANAPSLGLRVAETARRIRYLPTEDPMPTQIVMDRTGDARHYFHADDTEAVFTKGRGTLQLLTSRWLYGGCFRGARRRSTVTRSFRFDCLRVIRVEVCVGHRRCDPSRFVWPSDPPLEGTRNSTRPFRPNAQNPATERSRSIDREPRLIDHHRDAPKRNA